MLADKDKPFTAIHTSSTGKIDAAMAALQSLGAGPPTVVGINQAAAVTAGYGSGAHHTTITGARILGGKVNAAGGSVSIGGSGGLHTMVTAVVGGPKYVGLKGVTTPRYSDGLMVIVDTGTAMGFGVAAAMVTMSTGVINQADVVVGGIVSHHDMFSAFAKSGLTYALGAEAVAANSVNRTGTSVAETVQNRWAWMRERLATWSKLPTDWDGDDGQPPGEQVVANATDFLVRAQIARVPLPEPYIAGDGEVGYRWKSDNAFASAAFLPDGHMVAFAREANRPTFRLDRIYSDTLKLDEFVQRLRDMA